jgi:hypothetical protein
MTEDKWLASTDSWEMLNHLWIQGASRRKLRLVVVACCRRVWHLGSDERVRHAVEVAERYADGFATDAELDGADAVASAVVDPLIEAADGDPKYSVHDSALSALAAMRHAACRSIDDSARYGVACAASAAIPPHPCKGELACEWCERERRAANAAQVPLVRCVFGNPFRPVAIDPAWLSWNGGIVVELARGMYDDSRFDRMPILGDALEDAGCENAEMLAHCRNGVEHRRGCWVLDLVLGKK